MNSLVRGVAKENTLSRVSASLHQSCGTSPAARRLLSARGAPNTSLLYSASSPSAIKSQLRSPFLPSEISANARSTAQLRSFHQAGQRLQEQKPKDTETEVPKEKEEEKASEQSEPKSEEEQGKDGKEGKDGENGEGEGKSDGKEKKEDLPPPPPHGDKTPWQVFMETMNTEFQASKEWNESTKQIGAAANQFAESESVRRAREAYEKSTGAVSSTVGGAVKTTAGAIGKGAAWTWDTNVVKGVRKAANATGDAVDKATKPIRDTDAYKNVKNVIDDGSSSRYGGWVEKEERKRRREAQEGKQGGSREVLQEDPEAGTNVTLHKDAAWKEAWRDFRDTNKFVQGIFSMKGKYEESENPLVSTARSITDRIGGFFAENETAMVIKKFRTMDPAFQTEPFLQEL
ncbi:hypothetical protein Golomagni_07154, partial [Golovinomyces magnicellulatus]